MNWWQLWHMIAVNFRLVFRNWAILLASTLILTAGMLEIIFVRGMYAEVRNQLDSRALDSFQIAMRTAMNDELASTLDSSEVEDIRAIAANTGSFFLPQFLRQAPLDSGDDAIFAPRAVIRGFENFSGLGQMRVQLIEGRWPRAGADEVIAGFDLDPALVGQSDYRLVLDGRTYQVVGRFQAAGTPFQSDFIVAAEQIRTDNAGWSSVWLKIADGARADFRAQLKERTQDAVSLTDASSFFDRQFSESRTTALRLALGLVAIVILSTAAAFASSIEIIVRKAQREIDILYLIGIDRIEIIGALGLVGGLIGAATGSIASGIALLFLSGNGFPVPIGTRTLLIYPHLELVEAAANIALAFLTGALCMIYAARRVGSKVIVQ